MGRQSDPGFLRSLDLYQQDLRVCGPDVLANVGLSRNPHDITGLKITIARGPVREMEARRNALSAWSTESG